MLVLEAADDDRRRHAHRGADAAGLPARRVLGDPPARARLAVPARAAAREHGLELVHPGPARAPARRRHARCALHRSVDETAAGLGADARRLPQADAAARRRLGGAASSDLLGPLRLPRHPLAVARFGRSGLRSATRPRPLALRGRARARRCSPASPRTRCCRSTAPATAGFGLVLHAARPRRRLAGRAGGSQAIADALASLLRSLGGEIETGREVRSLAELPPRARCCSTSRRASSLAIAGDALPRALPPGARALPLRARRVQARLRARRPGAVDGAGVPPRRHGAPRRHARGDRARGGRGRARPARRAAVRARRAAEPVRPDPRARRAHTRCGPTATCPTARPST